MPPAFATALNSGSSFGQTGFFGSLGASITTTSVVEGLAFGDLVHVISLRIDTNGFRFDTEPEGEDPAEMWQR